MSDEHGRNKRTRPTTAPNRPWFRWSLRTMFVVVTVAAAGSWLIVARSIVGERERAHYRYPIRATYCELGNDSGPPLIWRLFGATPVHGITVETATAQDVENLKRIFPEARISVDQPAPR